MDMLILCCSVLICIEMLLFRVLTSGSNTFKLQCVKHLRDHENLIEIGVVLPLRVNYSARSEGIMELFLSSIKYTH